MSFTKVVIFYTIQTETFLNVFYLRWFSIS